MSRTHRNVSRGVPHRRPRGFAAALSSNKAIKELAKEGIHIKGYTPRKVLKKLNTREAKVIAAYAESDFAGNI
jgi:hypothetical protein